MWKPEKIEVAEAFARRGFAEDGDRFIRTDAEGNEESVSHARDGFDDWTLPALFNQPVQLQVTSSDGEVIYTEDHGSVRSFFEIDEQIAWARRGQK